MEEDIVVPVKLIDTYKRRKESNDKLFQNLNGCHKNIKLTLEENPKKFLHTEIIRRSNTISTQMFAKLTKLSVH